MNHQFIQIGKVRHRRFAFRKHSFAYSVMMFYFDIAKIPQDFNRFALVSNEKLNCFSYMRDNYFIDKSSDLNSAVRSYLAMHSTLTTIGRICLLTNLSCFGYCFNPISIYFIHDEHDKVQALLLEVSNTPWLEKHIYLLDKPISRHGSTLEFTFNKALHVSPFMEMDYVYHLHAKIEEDKIIIHLANHKDNIKHFDASLVLHNAKSQSNWTLFRYLFMSMKVVAWIYWQALKLRLKGLKYIPYRRMK